MSSESLGLLKRLSSFVFNVMSTLMELGTLCEAGGEVHPWRCNVCAGCRRQALIDEARELIS